MALFDILGEMALNLQKQGPSIADLIAIREQRRREKNEEEKKKLLQEPVIIPGVSTETSPAELVSRVGEAARARGVEAPVDNLLQPAMEQPGGLGKTVLRPDTTIKRMDIPAYLPILKQQTAIAREEQKRHSDLKGMAAQMKAKMEMDYLQGRMPKEMIPLYEKIAKIAPKDKGFTLGPGQVRYDEQGNVITEGPPKSKKDRDQGINPTALQQNVPFVAKTLGISEGEATQLLLDRKSVPDEDFWGQVFSASYRQDGSIDVAKDTANQALELRRSMFQKKPQPGKEEQLPPQALEEVKKAAGQSVTFANGQTWKWQNGKAIRVK